MSFDNHDEEDSRIIAADRVSPDDYESSLGKAIATWRQGKQIPMTLVTELWSQGYDVAALQARHLR